MANKKITALNPLTGAASDVLDVYPVVDVSALETKKQTRAELFKSIPAADFADTFVFNNAGIDKDARFAGNTDANLIYTDASTDRVGIGTATPVAKLQINGSFATAAPVTITTSYTVIETDWMIISNRAGANTLTLPAAASYAGRLLRVMTRTASTVISASANVVPKAGGAAGTAILPGTIGAWAELQSDGTSWLIIAGGTIN